MMASIFALCCVLASCATPTLAEYGYGASSTSSGRGGYGGSTGGSGAFAGHGPINAAIRSSHHLDIIDMPKMGDDMKSSTIEVAASPLPLNILFRSASSTLNLLHQHEPAIVSHVPLDSYSEDEPHRLYHTVKKPIIQEVYEIISPVRKITQTIQPVQEHIQTIVARGPGGEQQVIEKAKLVDDLTNLKQAYSAASPSVAPSAMRPETGSMVKILKHVSFNDDAKPSSRQMADDMYRSSSTPSYMVKDSHGGAKAEDKLFAMMQDFNQESLPMVLPSTDFFAKFPKPSSRVKMIRKNRRMPPSMLNPSLPSPSYSYEALMEQFSKADPSQIQVNEIPTRNEIKIHKASWTVDSNSPVQLHESTFDDVYRSPAKMNRYEPIRAQQTQQQPNLEDDLFNLVRYEEPADVNPVNVQKEKVDKSTATAIANNQHRLLTSFYSATNDNRGGNLQKQTGVDQRQRDDASSDESTEEQGGEVEQVEQRFEHLSAKLEGASVGDSASVDVRADHELQIRGNATTQTSSPQKQQTRPTTAVEQNSEALAMEATRKEKQVKARRGKKAEVLSSSSKLAATNETNGASEPSGDHSLAAIRSNAAGSSNTAVNANNATASSTDQRK